MTVEGGLDKDRLKRTLRSKLTEMHIQHIYIYIQYTLYVLHLLEL